jgi:catechol 2,3-dioxygenase-like lactoylglutathione lyase family enzyme
VDLGVCRGQVFHAGADRSVILLPGANYPPSAPLLWFAREAALAGGWNTLAVSDTFGGGADPLRWAEERAEAAIRHVEGATRVILVAKSITTLAAPLAARLGLPAVWLTPLIDPTGTSVSRLVLDGLAAASAPCLLVGGSADRTWDAELARSIPMAEVLEISDADHVIQIPGDLTRSLHALGRVARAMTSFIDAVSSGPVGAGGEAAARLTGIDHVQLAMPPDREASAREFFGSVLGLREVAKPASLARRGGCWFVGLGIHLHLGVDPQFRPARKAHPAFTVSDSGALRQRLLAAGVPITDDDAAFGVRRFYALDPFGNRLEFIEHADRGFTEDGDRA